MRKIILLGLALVFVLIATTPYHFEEKKEGFTVSIIIDPVETFPGIDRLLKMNICKELDFTTVQYSSMIDSSIIIYKSKGVVGSFDAFLEKAANRYPNLRIINNTPGQINMVAGEATLVWEKCPRKLLENRLIRNCFIKEIENTSYFTDVIPPYYIFDGDNIFCVALFDATKTEDAVFNYAPSLSNSKHKSIRIIVRES